MARYTTKHALLEAIRTERARLEAKVAGMTPKELAWPGAMDEWSAKDILAHLVDWEQRFIGWYEAGRRGEVPPTPAPGMTWRDLAELNRQGFERHRNDPLPEVLAASDTSYRQILALVEAMPEDEIFTPGRYAWTRRHALVHWIEGNTCSHYRWARTQIRLTRVRREMAARAGSAT